MRRYVNPLVNLQPSTKLQSMSKRWDARWRAARVTNGRLRRKRHPQAGQHRVHTRRVGVAYHRGSPIIEESYSAAQLPWREAIPPLRRDCDETGGR